MEIWKQIGDNKGYYISSLGRVKKDEKKIIYKDGRSRVYPPGFIKSTPRNGYPYVNVNGVRFCIHTLVARAFLPPKPEWAQTVNHKDGNKNNNCVDNLEWMTYKDNNKHARKNLLNKQHGERCNLTKFSDDAIDAVRILARSDRFTYSELAELFNMSESHVSEIVRFTSRKEKTAD